MVKEIRGRSGVGNAPAHGLAPQNLSPDKHVDVCADSDEDRGSTPLASRLLIANYLWMKIGPRRNKNRNKSADFHVRSRSFSESRNVRRDAGFLFGSAYAER